MKIVVRYEWEGPEGKFVSATISGGTDTYDTDRVLGYLKKVTRICIVGGHLHCADILNRYLMSPGNKITHIVFGDSENEWCARFRPTYFGKLVEGLTHPNNKVRSIAFVYTSTTCLEDDKRMHNIIKTLLPNFHFRARLGGVLMYSNDFFGFSRLCAIRVKNNKFQTTSLFGLCWEHLIKSDNDCSSLPPLIVKEGIKKYGVWAEDIFDSRQKIFEIQKMDVINDDANLLLRERLKDVIKTPY